MIVKTPAYLVLASVGFLAVCAPSETIAQTADSLAAADRLIAVQNFEATMKDMAVNISAQLPGATEAQKRKFIAELTSANFLDRYKSTSRVAFAKHLSVEEMNTLTDFYSKPIAASAMKKMGATMAEVMPFIQAEIPGIVTRVMAAP
ncbi:MAG: DUF2059 domain-containing protein [Alcaligenaceae bacterium]|nr:MAG: DUF2059 domain-containing protein [Alcaligenaceae bacterium]